MKISKLFIICCVLLAQQVQAAQRNLGGKENTIITIKGGKKKQIHPDHQRPLRHRDLNQHMQKIKIENNLFVEHLNKCYNIIDFIQHATNDLDRQQIYDCFCQKVREKKDFFNNVDRFAEPFITHTMHLYGTQPWVYDFIKILHQEFAANLDVLSKGTGESALHIAVRMQRKSLVFLLLSNGADANVTTSLKKYTPLHYACAVGNEDLVDYLIGAHANVNACDVYNATPLHYVAGKCLFAQTYFAIPVSRNDNNARLAYCAQRDARTNIIMTLVNNKAYLLALDDNQLTPCCMARNLGHESLALHIESVILSEKIAQKMSELSLDNNGNDTDNSDDSGFYTADSDENNAPVTNDQEHEDLSDYTF